MSDFLAAVGILHREVQVCRVDAPRGRVNYLDTTGCFALLADRCIIRKKRLVRKIMAILGLPKATTVLRDLHDKCAVCVGRVPTREQEEKDWDF